MNRSVAYLMPNLSKRSFARTNAQTISQRVAILKELAPNISSISEICCGNCTRQYETYSKQLGLQAFRGLDIEPQIVSACQKQGIDCLCGDALDKDTLQKFITDNVIFFGPPLSVACDGHQILQFADVRPSYYDFAKLLLGELNYTGILVCICPKTTSMGDIGKLYHEIRSYRNDFNLRLIHHSYSTITGNDEITEMRLKYIELWFSDRWMDLWEVRESKPL